jgi:DNA-binding ferritin-like protein
LKGFVRDFGKFAQTARKHISELKISDTNTVVRNSSKQIEEVIFGIEMALGILQHHDAVAGTAKQKVTDDYVATSLRSIEKFNSLYKQIKAEEIKVEAG